MFSGLLWWPTVIQHRASFTNFKNSCWFDTMAEAMLAWLNFQNPQIMQMILDTTHVENNMFGDFVNVLAQVRSRNLTTVGLRSVQNGFLRRWFSDDSFESSPLRSVLVFWKSLLTSAKTLPGLSKILQGTRDVHFQCTQGCSLEDGFPKVTAEPFEVSIPSSTSLSLFLKQGFLRSEALPNTRHNMMDHRVFWAYSNFGMPKLLVVDVYDEPNQDGPVAFGCPMHLSAGGCVYQLFARIQFSESEVPHYVLYVLDKRSPGLVFYYNDLLVQGHVWSVSDNPSYLCQKMFGTAALFYTMLDVIPETMGKAHTPLLFFDST
jgi:hypothetical protein